MGKTCLQILASENVLIIVEMHLSYLIIHPLSPVQQIYQDRVSEFELKLMDIESEHLGIPETEYKCTVKLPAAEFQRIIRGY